MPVSLRIVRSTKRAGLVALALTALAQVAHAADKPPLAPDPPAPLAATSRVSATIEFGLPALAKAIEQDIPKRLATIDERVNCVHRRVLMFRVNANCDVFGFVNRTSGVSLYGRGDRVYGAVSIYGAAEGQGANRFTARIRGQTEARATIEAEARPALRKDWSLDLNFSDSFHWSEAPYLHVLGREVRSCALRRAAHPHAARARAITCPGRSKETQSARQGGRCLDACVRTDEARRRAAGVAASDAASCRICRRAGQRQGVVRLARTLRQRRDVDWAAGYERHPDIAAAAWHRRDHAGNVRRHPSGPARL
ncbi:hypothetical protein ACVWXN_010310 [Bradyrhizobium sp. i1.4.4]